MENIKFLLLMYFLLKYKNIDFKKVYGFIIEFFLCLFMYINIKYIRF